MGHRVKTNMIRSRKSGFTLVETLTSATLNVLVLGGAATLLIGAGSSWIRGEAKVEAETSAEIGVRLIADEVRGAMSVTVDSNGQGMTYQMPAVDGTGRYVTPIAWDGVNRRIALSGSSLIKTVGTGSRTVIKGVTLTDPQTNAPYRIFIPGPGSITRQLTMELVVQRNGVSSKTYNARNREMIYIRNVPQITK
jgi:type II secretory pathway pseudopilin PulG